MKGMKKNAGKEVEEMDNYSLRIKVKDGEVEAVLAELEKAQTVIRDCYCKLQNLGVLVVEKKEAASGN